MLCTSRASSINNWHHSFETELKFKARLSGSGFRHDASRNEGPWYRFPRNTLGIFEKSIRDWDYLQPKAVPSWIDHVNSVGEGPLLIVLLTMLSSFASLRTHEVGVDYPYLLRTIDKIMKFPSLMLLPILTSVELTEKPVQGYWNTCRFFHLPFVRS